MEAPSGFEPEMEVLQTSALPLGDGADWDAVNYRRLVVHLRARGATVDTLRAKDGSPPVARSRFRRAKGGAGNGIRTRDFDLGKVALYH